MDFETQFLQCFLDLFQPFRSGESQQGRFVRGAEEFKLIAHNLFDFEGHGRRRGGAAHHLDDALHAERPTLEVTSPRALRMLSMPRVTVPRFEQ